MPDAAVHTSAVPISYLYGHLVATGVSCAVGIGDILSRYKDNPFVALCTWAAGFYLVANALFGAIAFGLAVVLDIVPVERKPLSPPIACRCWNRMRPAPSA